MKSFKLSLIFLTTFLAAFILTVPLNVENEQSLDGRRRDGYYQGNRIVNDNFNKNAVNVIALRQKEQLPIPPIVPAPMTSIQYETVTETAIETTIIAPMTCTSLLLKTCFSTVTVSETFTQKSLTIQYMPTTETQTITSTVCLPVTQTKTETLPIPMTQTYYQTETQVLYTTLTTYLPCPSLFIPSVLPESSEQQPQQQFPCGTPIPSGGILPSSNATTYGQRN
jgi:hypothetical protein